MSLALGNFTAFSVTGIGFLMFCVFIVAALGYALATREQALAMSLRSLENLGGQ